MLQQLAVFVTIPFILAAPPVVGWALGSWLDRKLDTGPYIMFLGILLGFIAAFRDLYRLIKRYGSDA